MKKEQAKNARALIILLIIAVTIVALIIGLSLGVTDGQNQPKVCYNEFQKTDHNFYYSNKDKYFIDKCPSSKMQKCPKNQKVPPVIVISLDGFRAEYLMRNMTPNLAKIMSCGASTSYMRAMFPTKTFPNHYTLATGLYPESHGIIDNAMFDLETKKTFLLSNDEVENKYWYKGEPIWNTATKAYKKVVTMMWPGSAVDVQDMRPEWCYRYLRNTSYDSRIAEVLSYYDQYSYFHPDAAFIYIEQPDSAGHQQGPYGDWVTGNLTLVDDLVGRLVKGMYDRGYENCVNFVVVADHGMQDINCKKALNMTTDFPFENYFVYTGSHSRITSKYVAEDTGFRVVTNPIPVDKTMEKFKCRYYNNSYDWNVRFYKKEDLPKRYHYSNNPRIDEIVLDLEPNFEAHRFKDSFCWANGGSHGSDNTYRSMHAFFIAMGTSIKQVTLEPFENIEVYNILADLMMIEPVPTNGTKGRLNSIMRDPVKIENDFSESIKYLTCNIPVLDLEKVQRRQHTKLPILDKQCFNMEVNDLDDGMKLSAVEAGDTINLHLPLGRLGSKSYKSSCLLMNRDYVMGYSTQLQLPSWSAFTLSYFTQMAINDSNVLKKNYLHEKDQKMNCLRPDVRIEVAVDHNMYDNETLGIEKTFLFPPGFIQDANRKSDAHLLTNIVPMYTHFKNGVWKDALERVEEYAEKYKRINVIMGPIFDYNADGLGDSIEEIESREINVGNVPIPTHYYVSIQKCSSFDTNMACFTSLDLLSFILPHIPNPHSCWDKRKEDYTREHSARIKDIELLTGLTFLTGFADQFTRAEHITDLQEHLWAKWNWLEDYDELKKIKKNPQCPPGFGSDKVPLLVVSLDGVRPDYLDRDVTPVLKKLRDDGSSTKFMYPSYPSVTYPNHNTIVTGLYPESNGIVSNNMFDPTTNSSFMLYSFSTFVPSWYLGDPLWNTLRRNNKSANVMFWPSYKVPRNLIRFANQLIAKTEVEAVLEMFNNASQSYDFITMYFPDVDAAGHDRGPDSLKVNDALKQTDEAMGILMNGLMRRDLLSCINIVFLSDHGMADTPKSKNIKMSEILTSEQMKLTYIYKETDARISTHYTYPSKENLIPENKRLNPQDVIEHINNKTDTNIIAFNKNSLPKRFHYGNSERIDEIILLPAERYQVTDYLELPYFGNHGWDATFETMKSLFIGWGVSFKSNFLFDEPFQNIELYNLFCHLTGVVPSSNNGTKGSLNHFLEKPPPLETTQPKILSDCPFPSDPDLSIRSNFSYYQCPVVSYDFQRLKKDDDVKGALIQKHVSTGVPDFFENHDRMCLLHNDEYVSFFDKKTKLPKWSSFRLSSSYTPTPKPINYIPDVRLEIDDQYNCSQWQLAAQMHYLSVPLFEYGGEEVSLLSNMVPMHKTFHGNVWPRVKKLIEQFKGDRDVFLGPIFDYDSDGLADEKPHKFVGDIAIPSHYFIIILPVSENNSTANLNSLTFILPNSEKDYSLLYVNIEHFIVENRARIRDVELLTNLQFFISYSTKHHSILSRLHITTKSWRQIF